MAKLEKFGKKLVSLSSRLKDVELILPKIEAALAFNPGIGIFAAVTTTGAFPNQLTGTILGKAPGGNECNVVVTSTAAYEFKRRFVIGPQGQQTTCDVYEINITTTVREENCPQGTTPFAPPRTTTHKFEKTYCGTDGDTTTSGSTAGFDNVETDTLTFEHGTKVKVERGKPQGKKTVSVTYQDGTSVSTVVP